MKKLALLIVILVVAAAAIAVSADQTQTIQPPGAFQVFWYPPDRLEVEIYPNGEWFLEPDCYDWPENCWDILGEKWGFRLRRAGDTTWEVTHTWGDYTPSEDGVEQVILQATLQALAGDPTGFQVFDPPFDGCYVDLLTIISQCEWQPGGTCDIPAEAIYPQAGPWSRCPW